MQKIIAVVVTVLLAITAFLVTNPPSAAACSCMVPPPAHEAVEVTSLVFVAHQVDRYEVPAGDGWSEFRLVMDVSEVYKGEMPARIEIVTGAGDGDCGVNFSGGGAVGFAIDLEADGSFYVGLCGGSYPAAEIRALYDEPRPPTPTTTVEIPVTTNSNGSGASNQAGVIAVVALAAVGLAGTIGVVSARRRRT